MLAIESDTTLTSYEDAKKKCKEIDPISYPAEPYNQFLQNQLNMVLSNSSLTETEFWIGKFQGQRRKCIIDEDYDVIIGFKPYFNQIEL